MPEKYHPLSFFSKLCSKSIEGYHDEKPVRIEKRYAHTDNMWRKLKRVGASQRSKIEPDAETGLLGTCPEGGLDPLK